MNHHTNASCAVILTALPTEYQAVRAHLTDLQEETHPGGTVYERGTFISSLQRWDIGIVEARMGTGRAAFEAGRAIDYFKPSLALFVGIAGGIKDVGIGDVVAATKVYGYESGKAERTFRPRPEVGNSTYRMVQRAQAEARSGDWLKRIKSASGNALPPRAFVGPIAAGDKVLASTRSMIWKFLKQSYGDTLAIEMEGSGFLQATYGNQHVEALIIRGISDLIDGKSESDHAGSQEYAAHHASAFAFEILAKLRSDELASPSKPDIHPTGSSPRQPMALKNQANQRTGSGDIIAPVGDRSNITIHQTHRRKNEPQE